MQSTQLPALEPPQSVGRWPVSHLAQLVHASALEFVEYLPSAHAVQSVLLALGAWLPGLHGTGAVAPAKLK